MNEIRDATLAGPRRSLCIFSRRSGRSWWRVDADIAPDGTLTVTSGDSAEWQAVLRPAAARALLDALRRTGDLGLAVGGDADDELLARLADRFSAGDSGHFEAIKAYLDANGIAFEHRFWASADDDRRSPGPAPAKESEPLALLLAAAAELAGRAGNDFSANLWDSAAEAKAEFLSLAGRAEGGNLPAAEAAFFFTPAGPLQELAMASGWTAEFLALAERVDRALAR